MNFFSFVPHCYKNGLVRTLVDRTFKINNNWISFDIDLKNLRSTLCKNLFPPKLIDKVVNTYLNKTRAKKPPIDPVSNIECRYYKLPYIGKYSTVTKHKVKELVSKFCKNIDLKIIFTTSKISEYFSTKDPIPQNLLSMVVYKFVCANCNVCYVGETSRHLTTRIKEHLSKDKASNIYKHLKN